MKFNIRHKIVKITRGTGRSEQYRAHRDKNQVWLTSDGKVVFKKVMDTVAQAKAWMNRPSM